MKTRYTNNGSVMLITVFIIALLSVVVVGILQINTEDIQLIQNQIYGIQALATAEAGLNDAFAGIRDDYEWDEGFDDKSFDGGFYNVSVTGSAPNLTIVSEGTAPQGYVAKVTADVTIDTAGSDHTVRIDNLRVNE